MARLGAFCFPGTGHINPMAALGRELEHRGHEFVIFGIGDSEEKVCAAGIEFHRIGVEDYPPGTLKRLDQQLAELKGLAIFRFTVERVKNTARMVLRDGPDAVRTTKVDALLVDEADMGGNVAEYLHVPFISIAFFPPLLRDDRVPAFCFPWNASESWLARLRNRLGMRLLTRIASPIFAEVNRQRRAWHMPPLRHSTEALSALAQIAQLPAELEFDVPGLPAILHYTGPFIDHQQRPAVVFPWERLEAAKPLVYASMGTLLNSSEGLFRVFAQACARMEVQLVISLGGGLDPERLGKLPGDPIVVRYAPQLELLRRASAVITHAGLNTVLESLNEGVPMVAIPQGNDQPGVAARIAARGAGVVLSRRRLTVDKVATALRAVLEDGRYREAARRIQRAIRAVNGVSRAADIIEDALKIRVVEAGPLRATEPLSQG